MTAQLANGGYKIKPQIIVNPNEKRDDLKNYIKFKNENPSSELPTDLLISSFGLKPLFRNQENINFVKEAMYSSSNEPGGTSYRSRLTDKKFMFAGKTGSSQVRRFTALQRLLEVKQDEIEYEKRDHALFIAFAPVKNPKYAISVVVEHGGSGSSAAAPIAKKVIKKVLERDELRESLNLKGEDI
jgi:penicillin-binding protein 2